MISLTASARLAFAAVAALAAAAVHAQSLTYTPYTTTTLASSFSNPEGVAVDSSGNVYVADSGNHRIVEITAGVTTIIATAITTGPETGRNFGQLGGICVDSSGNVYATDHSSGEIYEVSGSTVSSFYPTGTFSSPNGIAIDSSGNVYVADTGNYVIQKISHGVAAVFAGSKGNQVAQTGTGTAAGFLFPEGVAVDSSGNVYVTDSQAQVIRIITPAGVVSNFAGVVESPGPVDGPVSSALLDNPTGIAVDASGNVYFTDTDKLLRRISNGVITTLAGNFSVAGSINGTGSGAWLSFNYPVPAGVAVDGSGNVYIADTNNGDVREASPALVITVQPASQSVYEDDNVTFSVTAPGATSYAWNLNGTPISGATSSTYAITDVPLTDSGNSYTVTVTNGAGATTTSNAATLTVTVPPAPTITTQPASQTVSAGSSVALSVAATGDGTLTYQWSLNGTPIALATSSSYSIASAAAADEGNYTVAVTNLGGTTTSNAATLTVTTAPVITTQPPNVSLAAGASATLTVIATGATSYQWYLNGTQIQGANSSSYTISDASTLASGSIYTVAVGNGQGTTLSSPATITVTNLGRLVDISILSDIANSLSAGFVIGPASTTGSENVLVRATGPALTAFGVTDQMPDPTLTVIQRNGGITVAQNAGWGTPSTNVALVQAADTNTEAFPLTDTASLDSALVADLPGASLMAGNSGYQAVVASKSGTPGEALTEVYDDTAADAYIQGTTPRLVDISCLAQVASGSTGSVTVGFVVGPGAGLSETVLIRAIGPTLAQDPFNLTGTMPDPVLVVAPLGQAADILAQNAGWAGSAQVTQADFLAATFNPTTAGSKDSAVVLTLPSGAYTIQVTSASGVGGQVLVEVYEVP